MEAKLNPANAADHLPGRERLPESNVIKILDAGAQYVDLIEKAVRRLGYRPVTLPLDTPLEVIEDKASAVIISGGPANAQDVKAPTPDPRLWTSDLPTLGICYGQHVMVTALGGQVEKGASRQDGRIKTEINNRHPLFRNTKSTISALFTHGNITTELPPGFEVIGQHTLADDSTLYSAIAKGNKMAVQFHPEVFDDTPEGYQILKNFLEGVAGLKPDQELLTEQLEGVITQKRAEIKEKVDGRPVIAFVSGGVDSAVATALAATVIDDLHCVYIDTGFMRDEDDQVIEMLERAGITVRHVDAVDFFANATVEHEGVTYGPLSTVVDPEIKRLLNGTAFDQLFDKLETELRLKNAVLLQGTNAADRIESGYSKGGKITDKIKTHHNQVPRIQLRKAAGKLLEPLDDLYKDEIRELGRALGLPEEIVERQPAPGPNLLIRIICTAEGGPIPFDSEAEQAIDSYLAPYRERTHEPIKHRLLPVRSVGVGGDERSYLSALALQDISDWETLAELAVKIPGAFHGDINRVIVALGDKPLDKASSTPTMPGEDVRRILKPADSIVFQEMRRLGLMKTISQCPVVLLHTSFGGEGQRSIVLRPVDTRTYMTAQAMLPYRDLPFEFVANSAQRILREVPGISQVFLDLTNKPPATIEWE